MATTKRKSTKKTTGAKKTGKAGNAARMKKITTRAKEIRTKNPSMKWTSAIKKASKELF